MNDFSLGYVLDGKHFGTGIGIGKLPEAFAVREHLEDGGYVETSYVPERTCVPRVVPRSFTGDSEPSFYQAICDCGWIVGEDGASSLSDFEHVDPYCGGCGAKVVSA